MTTINTLEELASFVRSCENYDQDDPFLCLSAQLEMVGLFYYGPDASLNWDLSEDDENYLFGYTWGAMSKLGRPIYGLDGEAAAKRIEYIIEQRR